ncbi:MAG: hypothetical protein ACK5Q6_03595 [Cyanobacteriota bacterium]
MSVSSDGVQAGDGLPPSLPQAACRVILGGLGRLLAVSFTSRHHLHLSYSEGTKSKAGEEWRPALYQALGLAQAMQSLLQARQAIKVASGQRIRRAGRAVRLFLLAP